MTQLRDGIPESCLSALRSRSAVLVVGAGSSAFVRIPTWVELLQRLQAELGLSSAVGDDADPLVVAEEMVAEIRASHRELEYHKFLYRTFRPRHDSPTHDQFHEVLVSLGFAGIITTNYDDVLEHAVMRAYSNESSHSCDSVDLCQPNDGVRRAQAGEFLRDLPAEKSGGPRTVLHIHGHWRQPEGIILTGSDYERAYGPPNPQSTGGEAGLSLHRRVLSNIVAVFPLVFVGFSMKDPFFMRVVEDVRVCYGQNGDRAHFALLPGYDKERASELLSRYCVQPFFYYVPERPNRSGGRDHSALADRVLEVGRLLEVFPRSRLPWPEGGDAQVEHGVGSAGPKLGGVIGALWRLLSRPFRKRPGPPDVCSVTKKMLER